MPIDFDHRQSPARLPTNPRRKVAPDQRKRVMAACNNCNLRRIKCSGERPCIQCASYHRDCAYPQVIEKVSVPRAELDELRKKLEAYQNILPDALLDPETLQRLLHLAKSPPSSISPSTYPPFSTPLLSVAEDQELPDATVIKMEPVDDDSMSTPGRLFQDSDGMGRYLGESSGAAFLDRLKRLMNDVLPPVEESQSTEFTGVLPTLETHVVYDSRPLDDMTVNPLWLPSDSTITTAMSELRYLIQDGLGGWPCGGLYWWGDLETLPARPPLSVLPPKDLSGFRYLAFYHAVLALVCQNTKSLQQAANLESDLSLSESYFARAAILMGNPLDIKRRTINDVATLGIMCLYQIEIGAQDAAYMCVTAAIHISIVLGAHRGWVDERGKRVFWSIYILDRWLSCLMGRPPTISDDDIQLPLPADAPSMPVATGMRANIDLSRISSHVVGNSHHRARSESDLREPDHTIRILEAWRSALPPVLQLDSNGSSDDLACCLLHMRHNQLLIVAIRPFFYSAIKAALVKSREARSPSSSSSVELLHLKHCFAAAGRNMRTARHAMALVGGRRLFHTIPHFLFNAAVCLILQGLVCEEEITPDERQASIGHVDYAIASMERGRDCDEVDEHPTSADILRDLRALVSKLTKPAAPDFAVDTAQQPAPQMQELQMGQGLSQLPAQVGENAVLYDELMTWIGDNWPVPNEPYMNDY